MLETILGLKQLEGRLRKGRRKREGGPVRVKMQDRAQGSASEWNRGWGP